MRFIKVSNKIFEYKLTPKAFYVYCYLLTKVKGNKTILGYDDIAMYCHMSKKTAISSIAELKERGLVEKQYRHNDIGFIRNRYIVKNIVDKDDKNRDINWFKIDYEVFNTKIKPVDFVVYAYLRKRMGQDSKLGYETAFPSLNTIHKDTGISRSRVVTSISYLRTHSFLNRVKRHYKKTKAWFINRYQEFKEKLKKVPTIIAFFFKKAHREPIALFINNFEYLLICFCKNRGSPYFTQQLARPPNILVIDNKYYYIY